MTDSVTNPPNVARRRGYPFRVGKVRGYAQRLSATPLGWELLIGRIVMLGSAGVFVVREFPHLFTLPTHAAITLAVASVVFLATWTVYWTVVVGRYEKWQPAAALLILTFAVVAAFWANPMGMYPFYYVVVMAGATYRWPYGLALAATATAYASFVWWYSGIGNRWTLQGMVIVVGLATASVLVRRFFEVQLELHKARSEVQRLAAAQARVALARDLHDQLGQDLTVAVLQAEMLREDLRCQDAVPANHRADVVVEATRNALDGMRKTVTDLREPSFAHEVESARRALTAAGIEPMITIDETPLPERVDPVLAWALRELVTNTVKHSGATICQINLRQLDHEVTLTVTDDGGGCELLERGNGLVGTSERVAALAGALDIVSTQAGFQVRVNIPVTRMALRR